MKRLIITGLFAFLISTTFLSDNPPGWYQQVLPVSNTVTDISFIDSMRGWVITERNSGDAYILHTTNGGNNWNIQLQQVLLLTAIQFPDSNTGYVVGSAPGGIVLKTTNSGNNWINISTLSAYPLWDVKFVNKDTGWVCSDDEFDGGVFKTTNGGSNWQRQTTPTQLRPIKLFFINVDTGWALNPPNNSIYKTTNGGINWLFLNGISSGLKDLFFLSNDTGWIIRTINNQNGILKTINAGVNWFVQPDPRPTGSGLNDISIFSNSKGWIPTQSHTILSLYNSSTWGTQSVPSGFDPYYSIFMTDTITGYSGGTIFVKTEDGGGGITDIESNNATIPEDYILFQNYPNPFNPKTIINYELRVNGIITVKIFDIQGRDLKTLVNKRQNPGEYKIEFDGSELSSGVYYYKIEVFNDSKDKLFVQTKKMVLLR